ncbi:MAG: hypothetical protein R3B48_19515 [Kofleriaceae bacterium]
MRSLRTWLLAAPLALALIVGCNKPTEENCRKALANIRHLLGTERLSQAQTSVEGEVRRCRGGSRRESVECAMNAKTLEELRACNLIDIPADASAPTAKEPAPASAPDPAPATDPSAAPAPAATPTPPAATPAAPAGSDAPP